MKKRVKIPMNDAQALIILARKVRDKHVADGEASPLKFLNWAEINAMIDEASAVEDQANDIKRVKRQVYQARSRKLTALRTQLRRSRDILTGMYRDEMKVMGSWGFDVLDNKTSPLDEAPLNAVKTT